MRLPLLHRSSALMCLCLFALLGGAPVLRAANPKMAFFEKKIRPVLVAHCYRCHSTATKRRGGLALDSREGVRKGGDSGPAVLPGKPNESLLLRVVRYSEEPRMPPKGKLPDAVVADLEKWIAMGAPDPRTAAAAATTKPLDVSAGRQFWAFQPPRRHPVPKVKDASWPRGDIDAFLLAALEAKELRPAADADRAVLLRRAYFDLIGLPPTPEQIDAFVRDRSSNAFATVLDELLASPHFGERWGRHWLDVARYAESSGGGRSLLAPDAWRYRDYVIDAFNRDVPYDRFLTEQIAGDLLPAATPEERRRQLIATAFLVLGPTNYEQQNKDVLEMDVVDEQIDTMGRALLGLTLGCARCHDHKFDPIPTRDYYALAGILHSTQTLVHDNVSRWVEQPLPVRAEQEETLRKHEAIVADLKKRIQQAKKDKKKAAASELEKQLRKQQASGPRRPVAMAVREASRIEDCAICIRGNIGNRGAKVPRGFLQVASIGSPSALPAKQSGRRELAGWLASRDNPLTARVMVNRAWHHLFGAGLVRTVDNFGTAGERPSHPELLDYLAVRFMADGWSVKKLIRTIMLSRAYQMSSAGRSDTLVIDPENRLLAHMNRRRLDAECLRDAMLTISGRLDRTLGGPTIKKGTTS
ncbi:MAG TPA: PSD1 and planctomycete cytochrome C domain-containing protein, partial [Gemmataceae bacterium]|nr:PSD1 and planctomycete cytochrome C domain-containing protein [Gemmataceae bacterium]